MNLADLLFGAYRRDVLGLLLLHPGESYHVREIARMAGKPANTLYRELATLAEAGLLLRRTQGNQVHYQANPDSPIYEELRGILKKTTGIADVLRKGLAPLGDREFRAKLAGKEPFLRRILDEPKILLIGDLHDLEKSRGHRTAKAA